MRVERRRFIAPRVGDHAEDAIAVGSSIATVAVFDTNADSRHVIKPNARIVRTVDVPTLGNARIR